MKIPTDGPEFLGWFVGKIAAAVFVAWLITSFSLPLWAAALLVFCI